jgi:hypothetical protein
MALTLTDGTNTVTLPIPPQEISKTFDIKLAENSTLQTHQPDVLWLGTTRKITFPFLFTSPGMSTDYSTELNRLVLWVNSGATIQASFGVLQFPQCIISSLNFTETAWIEGGITRASGSITLLPYRDPPTATVSTTKKYTQRQRASMKSQLTQALKKPINRKLLGITSYTSLTVGNTGQIDIKKASKTIVSDAWSSIAAKIKGLKTP